MNRYIELSRMQNDGKIEGLQCQVNFLLIPKTDKYRKVEYVADFVYYKDGVEHIEDVKSIATAKDKVFILKKKLFYYKYHKEIDIFL